MLVCSGSFYHGSTGSQCQRNQSKCWCVLEVSTMVLQEVNVKGIRVSVGVFWKFLPWFYRKSMAKESE